MITYTACTQTEVENIIENSLSLGLKVTDIAYRFTKNQLADFIDAYSTKWKDSTTTERSMSKSLCCFLHVLEREGPSHYSKIRDIVKEEFEHMTNDYSSLQYWRLMNKSVRGHGYWEINSRGIDFLQGNLAIAKSVFIRDKAVIKGSEERVRIFDFEELPFVAYNPTPINNETI